MRRRLNGDMNQVQTSVSTEGNICQTVIESVAEAEGTEPIELTPPLNEVIDPAALESLFANKRSLGKVIFNYKNCEVSVFPDGYVSVKSYGR